MLTSLLKMLNDDSITVDEVNIRFTGLLSSVLVVKYTNKATLQVHTANLRYAHYDHACLAREKLECAI